MPAATDAVAGKEELGKEKKRQEGIEGRLKRRSPGAGGGRAKGGEGEGGRFIRGYKTPCLHP